LGRVSLGFIQISNSETIYFIYFAGIKTLWKVLTKIMKIISFTIAYIILILSTSFGQAVVVPVVISDGISNDTLRFGLDPSGNGLKNDYREGSSSYTGQKKHRIRYQTGSGSTILISLNNLPANISIRIQDVITGSLIDTSIYGPGSYLVLNPLGFSSLYLTVNYSFPTSLQQGNINIGIPENLSLMQNYPNPFNPETTIGYYLPENGNVKLAIYNSSGKLVRILTDSYKYAGLHEVKFYGEDLASGIYFYELQTEDNTITKRMVLLK
jgi:hypothetical protein